MTGLLVPMVDQRNATMALNGSVQRLPRNLDYRKKGAVTAVKDQVRHFYDNASVGDRKGSSKVEQEAGSIAEGHLTTFRCKTEGCCHTGPTCSDTDVPVQSAVLIQLRLALFTIIRH